MSRAELQTTHQRLIRIRRGLVTLLCSIIVTVVVITGWIIHRNYLGRIASAERETRNLVRVLEEHAARLFSEADGVLSDAADQITTQGGLEHLDESALNALFNKLLARHGLPQVQALFAATPSGRLRAMTGATDLASVQIGDRDYFQYWQTHAFAPLFVGQPVRNRVTGRWLVSLSRRLDGPQDEFAGIIAAALNLDYFDRFYGELELGANGSFLLVRNDGIVLVRLPMVEGAIGRSITDSDLFSHYLPLASAGTYQTVSVLDQRARIISYRRLAGHPVVAALSLDRETILADWRRYATFQAGIAAIIVLVLTGLTGLLLRQLGLAAATAATLSDREARLIEAQYLAQIGVWEWDARTGQLHWSEPLFELLGLHHPPVSAQFRTYARLVHPDDRRRVLARWRTALRGYYGSGTFDHRLQLPDGRTLHVHVALHVEHDAAGRLIRLFGFVQDVSERYRQREEYETVLQTAMDGFWLIDGTGQLLYVNEAYCQMSGYFREELLGLTVADVEAVESAEEIRQHIRRVEAGKSRRFESRHRRKDGTVFNVEISTHCIGAVGTGHRLCSFIRDITERKQVEQQVRLAATVFESSAEGILIADADNRIITVNQAFTRITGYASPEAVGRDPSILKSGRHPPAFYRQLWQALHETGCWQGELWNRRKSGEIYPTWLAIGVVRDSQGAVTHYIGIFSDITQHKQAQERIYFLAHYDALTELPNRRLLADRAAQAMAAAQRNSARLAVLFLDLDRFKQVNDTLGHLAGDLLLQAVAERLRKCVREADTLARLGGDEFVVMLPDAATPDAAARVARKCIETLAPPFNLEGHEISISPSIGVSLYPDDGDHLELLLKNADAAMYRAKAAGRNNYQFFNPDRVRPS